MKALRATIDERTIIPLFIFLAAMSLYVATLAPTVEWGDFGGYQTRVTIGKLDLAPQGHLLWSILARPFTRLPFGDAAFRVNLSSAFFAALALVVLYLGMMRITNTRTAGLLAILALAISHTFWTYAVVPKAYSLTLLILALCILWLHQWRMRPAIWRMIGVGAILGLGVMNHLIILTAAPAMTLFIIWHSRKRLVDLTAFAASFVAGLLPYIYLLSFAPTEGAATSGFVGGSISRFLWLLTSPSELLVGAGLTVANLGYQFLFLTLVGVWGWLQLYRMDRSFALMLLLIFLGDVAFVLLPTDPPVMMHWHLYHPAYLAFAYPLAFGISSLLARWGGDLRHKAAWATAIVAPALLVYYLFAPGAARAIGLTERLGVRDFPGRDTVSFLFTPSKAGDTAARQYGESVLDSLPPNAIIFADWTPYAALWYLQAVEGRRTDVTLLELPADESLLSAVNRYSATGRTVFLADTNRYYDMQSVETQYRVERAGVVYRLVPAS